MTNFDKFSMLFYVITYIFIIENLTLITIFRIKIKKRIY